MLAAGFLAALATAPAPNARQQAVALEVSTAARAMKPGEVVLVTIKPSRAIASLDVSAFGAASHPWTTGSLDWAALVGVPLTTNPDRFDVVVRAEAADGSTGMATVPVTIAPGPFATRRLQVDPQFADPPASARERITRESAEMTAIFARVTPDRLWRGPFTTPVSGRPTSSFGRMSILNGRSRTRHQGADFRAAEGTLVRAPNTGRVALAADYYFSGNTVILDHGGGLFSLFAHFSKILVEPGALVRAGDPLGEAGATGRVTGPHVHWAVRLNGTSVDPLSLIAALAAGAD